MIVTIRHKRDRLFLQARLEGEGGLIGDIARELKFGDSFHGYSYALLRSLGEGEVDLSQTRPDLPPPAPVP